MGLEWSSRIVTFPRQAGREKCKLSNMPWNRRQLPNESATHMRQMWNEIEMCRPRGSEGSVYGDYLLRVSTKSTKQSMRLEELHSR